MEQAYAEKLQDLHLDRFPSRRDARGVFRLSGLGPQRSKYYPAVKYGDRRWHFWQHTAEGHVAGICGYVDRNAFNGSIKDWQAWLADTWREAAHGA
jgi:lysozyme